MFQSISWSQYFTTTAFLLAFYYAYVGYKYYRWELLGLIGIKKIDTDFAPIPVEEFKNKMVVENHEDYLPKSYAGNSLQSIKDEIKAYVESTTDAILSKSDLLNALQVIVAKYPATNLSGHNNSLHQFILAETEAVHPGLITPGDLQTALSA